MTTTGNVCTVRKLAPGAIRGHWDQAPTLADIAEFEEFVVSVTGPIDVTRHFGTKNEGEALEAWLASRKDPSGSGSSGEM